MFNIDISPLVKWAVTVGGSILAVLALWATLAIHYEHKGRDKALSAIAAKDQGAIDAANEAKQKVDDCFNSGHGWSVTDGVCLR